MNHSQVYKNGQSFEEKKAAITSMLKERTVSSEDVCRFLSQIMKDNSMDDDGFELICHVQQQMQGLSFRSGEALHIIRSCEKLNHLSALFKFPQISQGTTSTFRDRFRDLIEIEVGLGTMEVSLYINRCLQSQNQEALNKWVVRIRAIMELGLSYSQDNHVFYYFFEPMLKAFFCTLNLQMDRQQRIATDKLAKRLIENIINERNLHYWHTLLDHILECARYPDISPLCQPNFVCFYIIKQVQIHSFSAQIPVSYFEKIFNYIGDYLLKIKPFHDEREVLCIIQSLTKYGYTPQNLQLIHCICSQISRNQTQFMVLPGIFWEFIFNKLATQTQAINIRQQYFALLKLFFIGMSGQIEQQYKELVPVIRGIIDKLLIFQKDLEKAKKEELASIQIFISVIEKYYRKLIAEVPELKKLKDILGSSSMYLKQDSRPDQPWIFDFDSQPSQIVQATKPIGIRNMINTCYFNSFIQCLFYTKDFRQLILNYNTEKGKDVSDYLSKPDGLLKTFFKMFTYLETVNKEVDYCPVQFKLSLSEPYRNLFQQQDAGEFGMQFLNDLQPLLPKQQQETLKTYFIGTSRNNFTCSACKKESKGPIEEFLHQSLSFSDPTASVIRGYTSKKSVSQLIEDLMKKEQLLMKCDLCSKQATCTKVLSFEKLPKYLIVSVNRFQYQNNTKVKILAQLQLDFQIEINQQKYDLYALIVHIGEDADHGHYVAYAKGNGNQWYILDDSDAQSKEYRSEYDLQANFISKQTPYIMFYRKQEKK